MRYTLFLQAIPKNYDTTGNVSFAKLQLFSGFLGLKVA